MNTATLALPATESVEPFCWSHEWTFETIYQQYQRKVFSLAYRMLGRREDAEDVTQDVFLQVFRKVHTFRGDASFSTWLYRVTVNAVLMHLRRGKRWACEQQTDDGDVEAAGPKPDRRRAENVMVSQLDLERAIEKISPGCRTVFILHDIDGFEHKDISRLLGISEGTSKSQLHDARMKLRKLLITSTQMSSV